MRAALVDKLDGSEAVAIHDIESPSPAAGQVIVRVHTAALNFFDTLMARGKYQEKPPLPYSPGGEVAGVVGAIGDGVTGWQLGSRVAAAIGWNGCREEIAVDAAMLIAIPETVPDEVAAGVSVTYGTAMHGLIDRAHLERGQTVAVLGAAGGAGLAAVEIATSLGARVIAVASSAEKLRIAAEHGADSGIDADAATLRDRLRGLTDDRGVEIVYDCVGGGLTEPALRAIAWGGRLLVIGFAAGDIPRPPLNLVMLKGIDIVGVNWGGFRKRDPGRSRAHTEQVLRWCAEGRLKPRIDKVYPLEKTAEALRRIEDRNAKGKVIVRVCAP